MITMGEVSNEVREKGKKSPGNSQVSVAGFNDVTAMDLGEFLEREVGTVWRCRVKTSCTPPDSFPDFTITDTSKVSRSNDYQKVIPHAFVHFALPELAQEAYDMAGRCDLFFNVHPLKVEISMDSTYMTKRQRTKDPFRFTDVVVEIGSLADPGKFLVSWKGPEKGVNFHVDPFNGSCAILFTRDTAFSLKDSNQHAIIKCNFKVDFNVRLIRNVKFYDSTAPLMMLMQLGASPSVYYQTAEDDVYSTVSYNLLDDEDPWIRTTDFTDNCAIGRCHFYKISFSPRFARVRDEVQKYFKDRRVLDDLPARRLSVACEPVNGSPNREFFFSVPSKNGVTFQDLFMVNCLVHKGIISECSLTEDFFDLLRNQRSSINTAALNHIYAYKRPIFDAFRRLKQVQEWLSKNPKLVKSNQVPPENVEVRRLLVTPCRAYCLPPEVELSNRVLRKYKDIADRFLRVTFTEEDTLSLTSQVLNYYVTPIVKKVSTTSFYRTAVFKRIKSLLKGGFSMCGRRYSFLAFSANQLRDRSAWFFSEDGRVTANSIRSWMGRFNNRNVAKYAARMGQCFSSTYATVSVPFENVNFGFPDIERNDYVFSDGIGKISPDLAMEVARKLHLTNLPCAFQIRFAGCKGVVAVWPTDNDGPYKLSLRKSMNKFDSNHTVLEINTWARFQPGFLNRQIITLLLALDVPDDVFRKMQDTMVSKLNGMLEDPDIAYEILTTSCVEYGNSAKIMLSAGFKPWSEPYLKRMLCCIRSGQYRDLLTKSRIFVPQGRWLLGCLDELAVLEHGQCFIQVSSPSLERCFVKHGTKFVHEGTVVNVVTGIVVVAKNPCLHPGDVRILEAVDAPALHHLVDCLVFPQKGDRPHTNEASGSDLDGDIYFVTWDPNLIPPSKKSAPPMDYVAAETKQTPREVSTSDIIEFFTRNMVNDSLGRICNAHVVHADLSKYGALDEKCLKLAELAATAVDFPKTGKYVVMPPDLKPKVYPDFMGKDDHMSYKSLKIQGVLYRELLGATEDAVKEAEACADAEIPYDDELEVPGHEDFLSEAWDLKRKYDHEVNVLLVQHNVNSEAELVTGHFWSLSKHNSKKQGDLKERLKNWYASIRKEFRASYEVLGVDDSSSISEDEKNSILEKKASAWYVVTYKPCWLRKAVELRLAEDEEIGVPVLLSFAWVAVDYLAIIKIKKSGSLDLDSDKPIDSLAKYLSKIMLSSR